METLISREELKAEITAELRFSELKNATISAAVYRKVLGIIDKMPEYGAVNPTATYFYGSSRE